MYIREGIFISVCLCLITLGLGSPDTDGAVQDSNKVTACSLPMSISGTDHQLSEALSTWHSVVTVCCCLCHSATLTRGHSGFGLLL